MMSVQLWCHATALIAEVILEGVTRVKGRCSAIGRNAMTADLQVPIYHAPIHFHRCTLDGTSERVEYLYYHVLYRNQSRSDPSTGA